jgi:hypothetical protein
MSQVAQSFFNQELPSGEKSLMARTACINHFVANNQNDGRMYASTFFQLPPRPIGTCKCVTLAARDAGVYV